MTNETFGQMLRRLRQGAGCTQRELAVQVSLDHTYISKVENGRLDPPSLRSIHAIARVIGANEEALLEKAGKSMHRSDYYRARQEATNWQETARQYARNADYWEERAKKAESLLVPAQ